MFHAEIHPAKTLKQIVESLKEVVNDCTFECSDSQMQVQAMDSGHVSLVSLELAADQFHSYRCERNIQLGVNIGSLSKMLKCSSPEDIVVLTSDSSTDVLNVRLSDPEEDRVTDFSMKLMDIDTDSLGIPQQEYMAAVRLPSSEFAKICRDIGSFGDNVTVEVTEDHVSFAASGDIGTGKVVLKSSKNFDQVKDEFKSEANVKTEVKEEKKEVKVKEEPESLAADGTRIKKEGEKKRAMDADDEGPPDEAEEEQQPVKKVAKKGKKETAGGSAKSRGDKEVQIRCEEPVHLEFALRYLTMFSKAQAVSDYVSLKLAQDVPLQVEFEILGATEAVTDKDAAPSRQKLGYLRYYLAPKVPEGEDEQPADGEEAPVQDE